MKKQTAMALAAVFAMSVAGTALAAPANPFVDVPAKHWAYDSINKLAQAGVISGYGDGTYKGDKTLTRYEVATIVAKAMANSEKADAAAQKEIEALKAEFGTELNNLGVRVDNLESKIDNVKITGVVRARYDNKDMDGMDPVVSQKLRTRLMIQGKINDQWTYTSRLENTQDMRTNNADNGTAESRTDLNWAYVQGKVGAFDVTYGRFNAKPAYGTVLDDSVDGINVGFGNKLKVNLFAGKEHWTENIANTFLGTPNAYQNDRNNIYIADLSYPISKKLNAKAAYFSVDYSADDLDSEKIYEVGMDYQFNKTLNLRGVYVKNTNDTTWEDEDTGYVAQLTYKGAKPANPGSFGMWAAYRNQEGGTNLSSTFDIDWFGDAPGAGAKGYEFGVTYAPMKNAVWTTAYTDIKSTVNEDLKGQYLRTQVEFYF
jgi:hypothetical protein